MIRFILMSMLSISFFITSAHGEINPIVRVTIDKNGVLQSFGLRLYDDVSPGTVNNFLNYINGTTDNGGSYDNSFIHRNAKDFVIQGGGFFFNELVGDFTYDGVTDTYPGGLQKIIVDPTIGNEFNLSNTRGTIAMAKVGAQYTDADSNPVTDGSCTLAGPDCILVDDTGPDSASSQWFINLVDSPFLDVQNGGFTVFGEVLQDSMLVIDDIATTATYDFSEIADFTTLPLIDYILGEAVHESNLIKIMSMNELFKISSDIDFGNVDIGSVVDATITIETVLDKELVIGEIGNIKQLAAPFSIIQNACKNTTLSMKTSCDIVVRYAPTLTGTTTDEFNIEFDEISFSYTFRMRASNAPDISLSMTTGDFGFVRPYDRNNGRPDQVVIIITNNGVRTLEILDHEINVTDGDGSEFQVIDNCANLFLTVGGSCAIPVNFIGAAFGDFSFTLTVNSNDPDEPQIVIPFTAKVANDSDGVADAIENSSPNDGDGNFDTDLDSLQSHVVSIPIYSDKYITMVTFDDIEFTDVEFGVVSNFPSLSAAVGLDDGVLLFKVAGLVLGVGLPVGLYLPEGMELEDFKLLGMDAGTLNEKWVSPGVDGFSGLAITRNATVSKSDGSSVTRDLVTITIKDGGDGDTDGLENGVISAAGLLLVKPKEASNSTGNSNKYFLILLVMMTLLSRNSNFRQLLWHYQINQSMSYRGDCWVKAPMERILEV